MKREKIMYDEDKYYETTLLSPQVAKMEANDDGYNETTLLSENSLDDEPYYETTLLSSGGDEFETTVLSQNLTMPSGAPKAYIQNIISQERVDITKTTFIIGSDNMSVDFYVRNPAVSRKHSKIIYQNNEYYLIDNKSTNHTVLDGIMIEPEKPMKLYNGALIEMADELFEFHIL